MGKVINFADYRKVPPAAPAPQVQATATVPAPKAPVAPQDDYGDLSRASVIARIKAALKRRSGRSWSVTGGKGTSYGWIRIRALPKDCKGDYGYMTDADCALLGKLLGLGKPAHFQGENIPARSNYYCEYIDRAEGRKVRVFGQQYWD